MSSTRSRWGLVVVLGGCSMPPSSADLDAHVVDPEGEHEDESEHAEIPRRVRLDDAVRSDAGISIEPVERRVVRRTLRLPGRVEAEPGRRAVVAARLSGIVESVAVRAGDRIGAGDAIAAIRTPDLVGLRAAEVALRTRAAASRADAERLRALVDTGMASEQDATSAEAEADAQLVEAEALSDRLRALGGSRGRRGPIVFELRAPSAGVVTAVEVAVGESVDPRRAVATIVAMDEVWFVAHVFERDVSMVREGSEAAVVLNAHPEDSFEGTVARVSYEVDPGARTLSARIPLRNEGERLRLGLFGVAFVEVGTTGGEPRLAVPRSAVLDVLGVPTVFVDQSDGRLERREVVPGEADTTHVEIVRGLREGERVVTRGAFSVKAAMLRDTLGEDHH